VTGSCCLLDSCPGFEFFRLDIMAGPSKKMLVSDEVVFYKLVIVHNFSRLRNNFFFFDSTICFDPTVSSSGNHLISTNNVNVLGFHS
jgi:hypothetical protein